MILGSYTCFLPMKLLTSTCIKLFSANRNFSKAMRIMFNSFPISAYAILHGKLPSHYISEHIC